MGPSEDRTPARSRVATGPTQALDPHPGDRLPRLVHPSRQRQLCQEEDSFAHASG